MFNALGLRVQRRILWCRHGETDLRLQNNMFGLSVKAEQITCPSKSCTSLVHLGPHALHAALCDWVLDCSYKSIAFLFVVFTAEDPTGFHSIFVHLVHLQSGMPYCFCDRCCFDMRQCCWGMIDSDVGLQLQWHCKLGCLLYHFYVSWSAILRDGEPFCQMSMAGQICGTQIAASSNMTWITLPHPYQTIQIPGVTQRCSTM